MTEHIAFAFLIGFLVAFVLVIPLSVGDTKKDRREGFRRVAIDVMTALTLEREKLTEALQDVLCFYDRMTGNGAGEGYTAAEVLRLTEIRAIAYGHPAQMANAANREPLAGQTPPASYEKPSDTEKTSHIALQGHHL